MDRFTALRTGPKRPVVTRSRLGVTLLSAIGWMTFAAAPSGAGDSFADRETLTADAIVERAIDTQGARELRDALRDFSLFADVLATIDGHETQTDIKQFYKADDKFRMEIQDSINGDSWQIKAYDGGRDLAWEKSRGKLRVHQGRSGHQDKEKIKSDLAELKRLLRYFFLSNLPGDGVTFVRLADQSDGKQQAHVIERRVSDAVRKKAGAVEFQRLKLFIEKGTYQLLGVEIPADATAKGARLNVCFWGRVENTQLDGKKVGDRLWIPKEIKVFENDRRQSRSQLIWVKINSGLGDSLFSPE